MGYCMNMTDADFTILQVIAPFVEKDSFIQIVGEGDAIWRWVFDGINCAEKSATITW